MKVFKIEIMFLDFDRLDDEGVKDLIENTVYPNHIMAPTVMSMQSREVDWSDDHPLNIHATQVDAYKKLFS